MTFELVAVIAIGTAFLIGVLMLIEHDRWAGATVRPVGKVPGSGLLGRLADRIRDSVLAWLVGGAVTLIRRTVSRQRDATGPASVATTRAAGGPSGAVRPVPVRPTRIVVTGERRPTLSGSRSLAGPEMDDSPRRRLWRDASAVLALIAVVVVAVTVGSQQPGGAVLSATATPGATSGPSGDRAAGTRVPARVVASGGAAVASQPPAAGATATAATATAPATSVPNGPPTAAARPPTEKSQPPTPAPTRPPAPAPATQPPGPQPTRVPVAATPTVRPSLPVAHFLASPISGLAPLEVSFADRSTGAITAWAWDFGDGSTSNARNPGHTFDAPGVYGVTLTVTGEYGSDSYALTIRVEAPTPTP